MADIFISYSQKDRAWVRQLVDALTAEGYKVWWDPKVRSGEPFDEAIERKLKQVRCVVAVWSTNAVISRWVRAEAAWAADRDKVVSIRIEDDLDLPLKFYLIHTERMVAWDGSREAVAFCKLVEDIRAVASAPKPVMDNSGRTSDLAAENNRDRSEASSESVQDDRPFSRFRKDLLITRKQKTSGGKVYIITDPKSGEYYELDEATFFLFQSLDGVCTATQLVSRFNVFFGKSITTDELHQFFQFARKLGLLEN
ncbi:MAG: toll/interleukin-1 receptor domain-containing protein [Pseudomonadota bacterium]|nr:toll/interleukin-1 receptor domain-containing protein [Pseudomonadota bacterium]